MGRLTDKRALITGSSSGIGAGLALAFADEGARVAINYPDGSQRENALALVESIEARGGRADAIMADVSREDQVDELIDRTVEQLGGIDILVNNAGIVHTAPVEEIPVDVWDRLLAVHLRSVFLTTRRVLPLMYAQEYGRLINTASQLAYKGAPGLTHYTAAKGAILSFTRSLALEIGTRNITANCVAPGATNTPILDEVPDELLEMIRESIPKKRIAEVDDIVPAYVFLASDESRHFHGQCLSPNGGDVFL
ncbi:MAG: SDR family NAD(P)-dependent oxidoreductase [Gammaproteobacteria bacterium]|nr:SDR family NAD(P)-dependent oxidoreductase [Gammaproteobacteria bacterium]